MGCANSMPLMTGSGGMVEAAKTAVNDTIHAGEEVLQDVGESINEAAVSVKEAVIGAVKSVGSGVDDLASNVEHKIDEKLKISKTDIPAIPTDENGEPLCQIIPLKDKKMASLDEMDEFKDMLDKMTEEQMPSKIEAATDAVHSLDESVKNILTQEISEMEMNDKTSTHSLDSLKTSTPEPEIINAMLNDSAKSAPSPKPTLTEMRSIEEMNEMMDAVLAHDAEKNKL